MLDYTGLKIENYTPQEYSRFRDLISEPIVNWSEKMQSQLGNLWLMYYPQAERLVIKNSIHKFANGTETNGIGYNNYNDFHFSDLIVVRDHFTLLYFNRPASDFKVTSMLEYGINITTPIRPMTIADRYLSYSTAPVSVPFYTASPRKGKPILRECSFTDWRIKVYDKTAQAKLGYLNTMRYEVVVSELRKLRNVTKQNETTLEDLCNRETWSRLGDHILFTYDNIKKVPFVEETTPQEDIDQLYRYCNLMHSNDIKATMNINTYKKLRAKYKVIYDEYDSIEDNLHNIVRGTMVNKIQKLIGG